MPDFKTYVRERLAGADLRPAQEAQTVEELASHLEELYGSLIRSGHSEEAAWRALDRQNWNQLAQDIRVGLRPRLIALTGAAPNRRGPTPSRFEGLLGKGLAQDLRSGWRLIVKDRGFAATTLLTLAVCIGANAAIFAIVNSVLLRPLPIPESDAIVAFGDQFPALDPNFSLLNPVPSYLERQTAVSSIEDQAMFGETRQAVEIDNRAQQTLGLAVTPSWFELVRVQPALGRGFDDAEGEIGNEDKIVLSDALWRRLYNESPDAIGGEIRLSGRPFTIVGVMPAGFSFFNPEVLFWIPLAFTDEQKGDAYRLRYGYYHAGRLQSGATVEQALAQVEALNAVNLERFPAYTELLKNAGFRTAIVRLQDALVRDVKDVLYLLWAGAAFVLVIGGVNIANLTVARSKVRARELATRLALGASRWRIARLLVLESTILATLGGLAGIGVALAILAAVARSAADSIPNAEYVRADALVWAVTLGAAILVGVLIGLASAAALRTANLNRVLTEESRGGTKGRAARLLRRSLVVAQVAISVVLLAGVGLLVASFRNLMQVDPGFDGSRVMTAGLSVPVETYADDLAVRQFSARLLEAIRTVPGVDTAGLTTNIPMGTNGNWGPIVAEGYRVEPGESVVSPFYIGITPDYLESMRTPLLRGRAFDERDDENAPPVMIVSEELARRFWGDEDPVGRRMYRPTYPDDLNRVDDKTEFFTVVGVVRDVRLRDLAGKGGRAYGAYYRPFRQAPERTFWVTISSDGGLDTLTETVHERLAAIDPQLPLFDVRSMSDRTSLSLASRRLALALSGSFGTVALLLAALGVYGVLAYLVAQRRREIGIRMALGSSSRAVYRLVFGEGLMLVTAGVLVGLVGTLALHGAVDDQLFGITAANPVVLGSVVLITAVIGLLACMSPARRATRVDPLVVLNDSQSI